MTGTGPPGRVTKEDVERAAEHTPAVAAATGAEVRSIPIRGMRKVIAERMHASLQEMAQLTLGAEVDMTERSRCGASCSRSGTARASRCRTPIWSLGPS